MSYDECWGRLTEDAIGRLKMGALEIGSITTLKQVMNRIGMPEDQDTLAGLIRWAYDNEKEVPIPVYVLILFFIIFYYFCFVDIFSGSLRNPLLHLQTQIKFTMITCSNVK